MRIQDKKEIIKVLKRWKEGDEKAYEMIYEYYYKYLYYVAFQFFHNHEKAEDAVQEAFIEVYNKIHSLNNLETFQAWIKQIVYRKCLNQFTYEKKDALSYSKVFDDEGYEEDVFYHEATSVDKIQLEDAVKLVIRKLSELDERKRIIGYLRFLEGYKAREIAEVTEINIETVNTNIRRIKILLKEELESNNYILTKQQFLLVLSNIPNIHKELQGKVLHNNTLPKKKSKTNLTQTIALSIGIAALATTIVINKETIQDNISILQETRITAINYSTQITNQPLPIDVLTSNQKYDDIYINDSKSTIISENGIYTISIKKENRVLDQKQIVITNIDILPPYIIEKKEETSTVSIYIKDDQGIDYEHIELYRNNEEQTTINIDKINNCIILPRKINDQYVLKVPDTSGNIGEFYINSYEREI